MSTMFSNLFPFLHSAKVSNTHENELVQSIISPKSSPRLSLIHPATLPDYKEERLSDDSEVTRTFVLLSPVPLELSSTSFRTTYDYYSIVNIINHKLRKYKKIFDRSKNFWLLELDHNIVLRISIFELNKIRVIEVFSLSRKGNFWTIYSKLKKKLNNIQDKDNTWLLEYSVINQIPRNYVEDEDKSGEM